MANMDIANPSEEHTMLREMVRDWTKENVEPQALEHDRDEKFNLELLRSMGELGLLGISAQEEYGGAGLDATACAIVHEELSASDPGFALAYLAHSMLFVNNLAFNGNEEQKSRILPKVCSGEWIGAMAMSEPDAGTDVLGLSTTAVLQDDVASHLPMFGGSTQDVDSAGGRLPCGRLIHNGLRVTLGLRPKRPGFVHIVCVTQFRHPFPDKFASRVVVKPLFNRIVDANGVHARRTRLHLNLAVVDPGLIVSEETPQPRCGRSPIQPQVIACETHQHRAHSKVEPTCCLEVAHAGIDHGVASHPLLPSLKPILIGLAANGFIRGVHGL